MFRVVCISCRISIVQGAKEESDIVCRLELLKKTEAYPHREKQTPLPKLRQINWNMFNYHALLFQWNDCSLVQKCN